ncbi:hypothetical protein NOMA109596_19235 [Nocardioides marinus]
MHVAARTRGRDDRTGLGGLGRRGGTVDLGPVTDLLGDLDRRHGRRTAGLRAGPRGAGRAHPQRLEDARDLLLVEGLLVEELQHQGVEDVAVLLEDVEGLLVGGGQEVLDLLVDDRGDGLGVVAGVTEVAAQERLGAGLAELDGPEPLGHAVLRDHRAGQVGGLLDVVAGAGGGVVEDHLLRRPAAEHVGQLVEHLAARLGVLVGVGQHHRVAERPAAGQDRDLVDRVVARERRGDEGVAALVVGGDELLVLAHQAGTPLRAGDDAVDGLVQRLVGDELAVGAGGEQRGLVEHVGQVGAGEAGGPARDADQVDVGGDRLAARVDLEDLLAAGQVGGVDLDLAVEAARAQQRGVEHVGTVGGRDEDDPAAYVEAVHLDEQLVEGLLALVVAAAHAGAAVATDGVDLVDEDDRGGVLLGLLEQVADAGGADADEHLDEVGAGDGVERHARLAGDRAGQQRLAGARGAVEQHALGDLGAHGLELGRLLEELLDLAELLDRLVTPGDVGEGRLRHVLGDQLRLGLGELHDAASAAALHVVEQPQEDDEDDDQRQERDEERAEHAGSGDLGGELLDLAVLDLLLGQAVEPRLGAADPVGHDLGAVVAHPLVEGRADLLVTVDERDRLDLAGGDVGGHLRGGDLVPVAAGGQELQDEDDADHGHDDPQPGTLAYALHGLLSLCARLN